MPGGTGSLKPDGVIKRTLVKPQRPLHGPALDGCHKKKLKQLKKNKDVNVARCLVHLPGAKEEGGLTKSDEAAS